MDYQIIGLLVTLTLSTYLAGLFSGWYLLRKSREASKIDTEDPMRGYKPVEPTENEIILEKGRPGQQKWTTRKDTRICSPPSIRQLQEKTIKLALVE